MAVSVHGHEAKQGETSFAFLVLRLVAPIERAALVELIKRLAPVVPDTDAFVEGLPEELEEPLRMIGLPWLPPEPGDAVATQRRVIEEAAAAGVEAAWFFQTGTSLPDVEGLEGEEDEDGDEDDNDDDDALSSEDGWSHVSDDDDEDEEGEEGEEDEDEMSASGEDEDDGEDDEEEDDEEMTASEEDEEDEEDETASDEDDEDDEEDNDDEDDEDEEEPRWSNGPPPLLTSVRFPVDGYPQIVDELDWEDFGIAFKLAGPFTPGENMVLLGFHTLWLSPYGGRYRNASITVDRKHHSAHLWVDRFAVPTSPEEQVHHLLWIVSKLDEVMPIVHARFGGATMGQKFGGLMGDTSEPFVLGGNPLLAVHASGGEAAVDAWLDSKGEWSNDEKAQMLRELAIELVTQTAGEEDEDEDSAEGDGEEVEALFDAEDEKDEDEAASSDEEDEDEEDADDEEEEDEDDEDEEDEETASSDEDEEDEDEEDEEDDEDDEDEDDEEDDADETSSDDDEEDEDEGEDEDDDVEDVEVDRNRYIAAHRGALLAERARAGLLDRRAAAALRPLLLVPDRSGHRKRAAIDILGALRDRESVPALIRILQETTITSSFDAVGKQELISDVSVALGAIGDPSATRALAGIVTAPGAHNDEPRAVAAGALATCLAAAPEPRDVDEDVLGALLQVIRERDDRELNAAAHFAYGRIAQQLPAERRDLARRNLEETTSASAEAPTPILAREAALVLAHAAPDDARRAKLRPLLHDTLTGVAYDHAYTVRNVRLALQIAEAVPEAVDSKDLLWLTRFIEPDIRARTHALLERLGKKVPAAPVFDARAAGALDDDALVQRLGEPHLVGHAALIAEAARRALAKARPGIINVVHGAIERARPGDENLLEPDSAIFEAAIPFLRKGKLDDATIALFERMLRHSNPHVKWVLLCDVPSDERLLGGMFYVLSEKWSWQQRAALAWLEQYDGTPAFEEARKQAGVDSLKASSDDDDDDADEDDEDDEDDEVDPEDDDEIN